MVRDRYLNVAPSLQRQSAPLVDLYVLGADIDAPAVGHRFPRVDDQCVDNLFDLANIDLRLAEVILNLDRGAQIRTVEREFRSVLQEVRDRGDLLQGSAAFGEGEQLVGEPGGMLRCLSRFGEEREQITAWWEGASS
jgi:hypothetical protein